MNVFVPAPSAVSAAGALFAHPSEDFAAPFATGSNYLHGSNVDVVKASVAVISENRFFGSCLTRCLVQMATEFDIHSYASHQEWLESADHDSTRIVLLCATGERATQDVVARGLDTVMQASGESRVIIISDVDQPRHMIDALAKGAKGYVSMNLDLEIALGAIRLVHVGGVFIPASGLMSMRGGTSGNSEAKASKPAQSLLTERQLEVLEHLRKGDPNKIIAHKMSMSEATVKIHVRNMMRKVKAKNRTELVCKSNELLGLY
jgi:DNA-binding NarL/FixJ family response regulator